MLLRLLLDRFLTGDEPAPELPPARATMARLLDMQLAGWKEGVLLSVLPAGGAVALGGLVSGCDCFVFYWCCCAAVMGLWFGLGTKTAPDQTAVAVFVFTLQLRYEQISVEKQETASIESVAVCVLQTLAKTCPF